MSFVRLNSIYLVKNHIKSKHSVKVMDDDIYLYFITVLCISECIVLDFHLNTLENLLLNLSIIAIHREKLLYALTY